LRQDQLGGGESWNILFFKGLRNPVRAGFPIFSEKVRNVCLRFAFDNVLTETDAGS
jgi:hypothetical protein